MHAEIFLWLFICYFSLYLGRFSVNGIDIYRLHVEVFVFYFAVTRSVSVAAIIYVGEEGEEPHFSEKSHFSLFNPVLKI